MVQRIRLGALREHRLDKGWNVVELADTSKVELKTVYTADDGQPVTQNTARRLAAALDLPVSILAGQQKLFVEDLKGGLSPGCHVAITQWGPPEVSRWSQVLHEECQQHIDVLSSKFNVDCACPCHSLEFGP